jgi:hypothetical protein
MIDYAMDAPDYASCKSILADALDGVNGAENYEEVKGERDALRARIEVLEKVVIDVDEAMRGDYHREGTKIRIVVTQESLNRFRAALDALKEGKG